MNRAGKKGFILSDQVEPKPSAIEEKPEPPAAEKARAIVTEMADIAGAVQKAKATVEGNAEAEQVLSEVGAQVSALQARMVDLEKAVLGLEHENGDLLEQIRRDEGRAPRKDDDEPPEKPPAMSVWLPRPPWW